ncbi:hypothetical protein HJC99_04350 [Candidatus Saccharibacteria bacterium]|nr:hypothetical protein [Candidatus Saccharibacteria bacterium]
MAENEPTVTWAKAQPVLEVLANLAGIRDVLVIGSVARDGFGNDLDVVLTVSQPVYLAYLAAVNQALLDADECDYWDDFYVGFSSQRFEAALASVSMSLAEHGWLCLALRYLDAKIDVQLMPATWLSNTDLAQSQLPHHDPSFVANIAADARKLAIKRGERGQRVVTGLGRKAVSSKK